MDKNRKNDSKESMNLVTFMRRHRPFLLTLCVAVVFVTTYLLILPAMTLDSEQAEQQGGIDVPAATQESIKAGSADSEDTDAPGELSFEGEGYSVSAEYTAKAGLPLDAQLAVEEIPEGDADYDAWCDEALKALQGTKGGERVAGFEFAKFYDISLLGAEGEIEPSAPVDVTISYDKPMKASDAERVRIVHFGVSEDGELVPEVLDAKDIAPVVKKGKLNETAFKAEGFSVYGVVYTVDFHYDVDGESYEYSFGGGDSIGLKELVKALHVSDDENFIAGVEKVEFSNEDLVKVVQIEEDTTAGALKEALGLEPEYSAQLTEKEIAELNEKEFSASDWALISLKAFDTEETLTITMRNGDVWEVKVTDSNFASTVDGKTFALIVARNSTTSGYALDANLRDDHRFTSRQTNINYLGETVNEEVYFCDDVASIKWTFEYLKGTGNQFYLKANNGQYAHYEDGAGFSLSNEPTVFYADVKPGDNDHVRLCIDEGLHNAINLYGGNNGFGIWGGGTNDPNELFTLCKPFNMSSSTPGTISTVDNNAEGIELKLFDYDYITTPGTTGDLDKDGNKISGNNLPGSYNTSVNSSKPFWFLGWGADSNESNPGINDFTGLGSNIRALQGIVQNNLVNGYPALAVDQNGNQLSNNNSLAYLFNGTATDTKSYTANHLFEKIGDKYSYDSNKHYAEFNKNTGNFTVYDGTLEQNSGSDKNWAKNDKAVGFFPFDSYSDMKGLYDNYRLYLNPNVSEYDQRKTNGQHYRMNHHNGMSLDAHFRLPEGGQDSYGNDIEFEFSGDDDLWVFIDDVLVLDIGGVHQPLNGKINFTTGNVTVDATVTAKGADSSKVAGASTTIEEMFEKAGKTYDPNKLHEMKVYWIERGGCDSNCKIEFNLPLTKTKEAGSIEFDKVSARNESLKLEGAVFTLYTDPECKTPFTIGNVPVTATSGKDGKVHFYAIPVGTYYIKETTFPEGYQAKNPEEIFTVTVAKDATVKPVLNGNPIDPVTNEPKKINVEVEKVWENDVVPDGASVEIVLGRYKLVEDPNAQGKGTLVIKDSYAGLPEGNTYQVTYTITGPDNYTNTIRKSYARTDEDIEISVPDLPAGVEYTVTKSVGNITAHNVNNQTGSTTVTVPKKSSANAVLPQSTFIRNAYKVRVFAVNNQNPNNVSSYSEDYYAANSALTINIEAGEPWTWSNGYTFTVSSSSTTTTKTFSSNGTWKFTSSLKNDIDLYIKCNNTDWEMGYSWLKKPYITGATPITTNSLNTRNLLKSKKLTASQTLSQTADSPALPEPPADTVYELDTEYAQDPDKITLSGNTWTGTINGLDADNEYGPYVYYIAQVNEAGMPPGTSMTIADEVSSDGSAKVLTVTNNVPVGDLQITKTIQKNGSTDASATGTFYYAVYDEVYNAEAVPAQTPVRTGSIQVTENGTKTVTEEDLYYGTYYVYELTGENGTPIVSGENGKHQIIADTVYKVTGSGAATTINQSTTTAEAGIVNNRETVSKTATKTWSDNTEHPTIYFKLFYEANHGTDADGHPDIEDIEVSGAEIKELTNGTTSVTWDDLPKYNPAGSEYVYLVKEYIKNGENYEPAAPEGYVKTESGLTVTNTKSEGYDPRTSYSGTKIWVDTANNGATRPDHLNITLYANGTALTDKIPQWTKGTGDKANEWTYTFSDLPVFDENGNYIRYTASEPQISGYDADAPEVTATSYQVLESAPPERITTNSNLDITLAEETDLAYIAIKKNANKHLIWTQRAITAAEKEKIYRDINATEGFIGEMSDSTVEFISGLPVQKVFEKGTVTITKTSATVMHVTFVRANQWAQICYGSYRYNYAPGTTKFTNRLHTITADATKIWKNASGSVITPPEGTTVTFDLFIGDTAQNKRIVLNGKTDVKQLDSDETIAATQEVNTEALEAKAYESEPWKAYWGDLAEYDSSGEKITYTIKEISVSEGFENQDTAGVASGGVITNKQTEIEIGVLKVDKTDGATPLTGAKFKLRRYSDSDYQGATKEWDEQEVSSEAATKGRLTFTGVTVGYYELEETVSPDGFIRDDANPRFVVTADNDGNLQVEFTDTDMVTYENGLFTVKNEPGAALPSTGGPGTTWFYLIGAVLLLGCGTILVARRRTRRA